MKKILFYVLFLLFGCQVEKTQTLQSSYDIEESKKKQVFISQYIPEQSSFYLAGQQHEIKEIWVEHYWLFDTQFSISKKEDSIGYISLLNSDVFDVNFLFNGKKNGITGKKLTFTPNDKDQIMFSFYHDTDTIAVVANRLE